MTNIDVLRRQTILINTGQLKKLGVSIAQSREQSPFSHEFSDHQIAYQRLGSPSPFLSPPYLFTPHLPSSFPASHPHAARLLHRRPVAPPPHQRGGPPDPSPVAPARLRPPPAAPPTTAAAARPNHPGELYSFY
jgi:hypothetical protein